LINTRCHFLSTFLAINHLLQMFSGMLVRIRVCSTPAEGSHCVLELLVLHETVIKVVVSLSDNPPLHVSRFLSRMCLGKNRCVANEHVVHSNEADHPGTVLLFAFDGIDNLAVIHDIPVAISNRNEILPSCFLLRILQLVVPGSIGTD